MVAIARPGKASEKEKPLQLRAPFLQEPPGSAAAFRLFPMLSSLLKHSAIQRPADLAQPVTTVCYRP